MNYGLTNESGVGGRPLNLTLAAVGFRGDGETRGTAAGEAPHDVVAGVGAGRFQSTLVLI